MFGGAAGLEIAATGITQDCNIDVIHRDLELRHELTSLRIALDANQENVQPDYRVDRLNNYRTNSRLGVLD